MLTIANHLKPYSHESGLLYLLPAAQVSFRIYPTRLEVMQEDQADLILTFHLKGPIDSFTVIQDLDHQKIQVFGFSEGKYFCYHLIDKEGVSLYLEKAEAGSFQIDLEDVSNAHIKQLIKLQPKEILSLAPQKLHSITKRLERLSFGCHKKQEWQGIKKRSNPDEFLPFWYQMGQQVTSKTSSTHGLLELLVHTEKLLDQGHKEDVLSNLSKVFQAGFQGVFHPRLHDEDYQGICQTQASISTKKDVLEVLRKGYEVIRSLFYKKVDQTLHLLPYLPKEFHSGRLLNIEEENQLLLSMEWSKKQLRVVELGSYQDQILNLVLQPDIRSFRIRKIGRDIGQRQSADSALYLKADTAYILDRFER